MFLDVFFGRVSDVFWMFRGFFWRRRELYLGDLFGGFFFVVIFGVIGFF